MATLRRTRDVQLHAQQAVYLMLQVDAGKFFWYALILILLDNAGASVGIFGALLPMPTAAFALHCASVNSPRSVAEPCTMSCVALASAQTHNCSRLRGQLWYGAIFC